MNLVIAPARIFVTNRWLLDNLYVSLPAASFHDVYRSYGAEVYRFALYLSGDSARAEDLTAEAFLRIWASPAPARLDTVKSYLFAIVRNLYAQAWRREKRETPLQDQAAPPQGLERMLDKKAELARVLAALQELDPVERAAVLLRGEHQMAYEDIARLLDLSPNAARVKVHRARQKLMDSRKGSVRQ